VTAFNTALARILYILVFAGGWLFFVRGIPQKHSSVVSAVALVAGLFILLVLDHGSGFFRTCLRYALFLLLYAFWSLFFLDVQQRYSFWLSGFFVLLMGACYSVVQILFRMLNGTNTTLLIFLSGLARLSALLLLFRLDIRPDGARDISVRELLLGLFPAVSCFLANLFLFEIIAQQQEVVRAQEALIYLLSLFFGFSGIVVLVNSESYFALARLRAENEEAQRQLDAQYRLFLAEKERGERMRALRHDIANHLQTIERMAEASDSVGVRNYARELQSAADAAESPMQTGNTTLDAVLSAKIPIFAEQGIRFENFLSAAGLCTLSPMEISALFGNALDNAAEAVASLPKEARTIRLSGGPSHGNLVVKLTNPYDGERIQEGGRFRSSKENDGRPHGYGLGNMERIVRAHGGMLTCRAQDGIFTLVFAIPDERGAEGEQQD